MWMCDDGILTPIPMFIQAQLEHDRMPQLMTLQKGEPTGYMTTYLAKQSEDVKVVIGSFQVHPDRVEQELLQDPQLIKIQIMATFHTAQNMGLITVKGDDTWAKAYPVVRLQMPASFSTQL